VEQRSGTGLPLPSIAELITTVGRVLSTVKVTGAVEVAVLPAPFVACAVKLYVPSPTPASKEHITVAIYINIFIYTYDIIIL
jgi:hypothetical protein